MNKEEIDIKLSRRNAQIAMQKLHEMDARICDQATTIARYHASLAAVVARLATLEAAMQQRLVEGVGRGPTVRSD